VLGSVDELRAHLEQTRARGYALAVEEGEIGTVAMATVFRAGPDADAAVAGTLSVAGPTARMGEDRRAAVAAALAIAAREMAAIWPLRRRQIGAALQPHAEDAQQLAAGSIS
jgi:IclR family acetate operon transcriptional repressor